MVNIKEQLIGICEKDILDKILSLENNLTSIIESRNNETKSSAGDKYETGRAMMQIEEQKTKAQLLQLNQQKNELSLVKRAGNSDEISLGSLVETNKGIYFISIGYGKVKLENTLYYCISNDSPVSKILKGKRVGEEVVFNGNKIMILNLD